MISALIYTLCAYLFCVLFVFCYAVIAESKGCVIRYSDIINPNKWVSFIKGTLMSIIIPRHKFEQIAINRIFNENCKQCLDKGCCINCGCATYEKMLDSDSVCSSGHWYGSMSAERWEEWKDKFEISLTIKKK
jgi:hypothetical protein